MLQNFPQSYEAFTEALALEPKNADLWYNRSMASRFTMRFGQALRDIERAIELNTSSELTEQFDEALQFSRQLVEESIKLRGPDFTLDQLVKQENFFQLNYLPQHASQRAGVLAQLGTAQGMLQNFPQSYEAFTEALALVEIDPKYTIAKNNLVVLRTSRRTGPPALVELNEPFKNSKLNQSITFIKE